MWHTVARSWLAALLLTAPSLTPAVPAEPPIPEPGSLAGMELALRKFRFGTDEERLAVARSARRTFSELARHEENDPKIAVLLDGLTDVLVEDEQDEWILFNMTRGLAEVDARALNPMFLELLDHPSSNVRRQAAIHFSSKAHGREQVRKHLERSWRGEKHPQVQRALLAALTYHESSVHSDDLIELIWSDDPDLAHTAVVELAELKPPGSLQALAERSFAGPGWLREETLSNLLEWKDSAEAVSVYAEHIAGDDPTLRNYAARHLQWFAHPDAGRTLARLVADPAVDLCVRRAAAGSLDPTRPEAERALRSLLAEPTTSDNADVQRAAAHRLARAGLATIDPTRIPNQQRHWECSWNVPSGRWKVEPPESLAAIRCWEWPGTTAHPSRQARLARNRTITPDDYFESAERAWVHDRDGCWVRADHVVVDDHRPHDERPPDGTRRVELEALPEEIEHPEVRRLLDLGLAELVDRSERVVAVAIEIHEDGEEETEALRVLRAALKGPLLPTDGGSAPDAPGRDAQPISPPRD